MFSTLRYFYSVVVRIVYFIDEADVATRVFVNNKIMNAQRRQLITSLLPGFH